MRLVQAVLLALSVALVLYYEIPLGRNTAGILFGYAGFVIASILILSFREGLGVQFHQIMNYGQAFSYRATLAVWLYSLWNYYPAPIIPTELARAHDFELMALDTQRSMAQIRRSLGRVIQS